MSSLNSLNLYEYFDNKDSNNSYNEENSFTMNGFGFDFNKSKDNSRIEEPYSFPNKIKIQDDESDKIKAFNNFVDSAKGELNLNSLKLGTNSEEKNQFSKKEIKKTTTEDTRFVDTRPKTEEIIFEENLNVSEIFEKSEIRSKSQDKEFYCLGKKNKKIIFAKISPLSRKYRPDCIRKKIKVNHFKFLKFDFDDSSYFKLNKNSYVKDLIENITIKFNKNLYSKKLIDFFRENSYILKCDVEESYEKTKEEGSCYAEKLEMSLFEYFEDYYYNDSDVGSFRNINLKYIEEKSKNEEDYFKYYNFYDFKYLEYFKTEKSNKERKDIGIGKKN